MSRETAGSRLPGGAAPGRAPVACSALRNHELGGVPARAALAGAGEQVVRGRPEGEQRDEDARGAEASRGVHLLEDAPPRRPVTAPGAYRLKCT